MYSLLAIIMLEVEALYVDHSCHLSILFKTNCFKLTDSVRTGPCSGRARHIMKLHGSLMMMNLFSTTPKLKDSSEAEMKHFVKGGN